jgi:hypothetical protein
MADKIYETEGGTPIGASLFPSGVGYYLATAEDIYIGDNKSLADYIGAGGGGTNNEQYTTWLFNDEPDLADIPTNFYERFQAVFTCDNRTFIGISGNSEQLFYLFGADRQLVYDSGSWQSESYKTITIQEEITDLRLYIWLRANATLISGETAGPLQPQYDEALDTNSKTVVGAINEIFNAEQGEIILPNNVSLRGTTTSGATPNLIQINSSNNISVGSTSYSTYMYGPASKGVSFPNGITVAGDSSTNFLQITGNSSNPGMRLYNGNFVTYKKSNAATINAIYAYDTYANLWGTWKLNSATISTSWRGGKHDIEELPEKYSSLFDNLRPVRFKYNDGTSGRYHTGLILEELKDAMDVAGVDSSELASYCILDKETGEGGIRYEELISLAISEVQKLKKKNQELEQRIVELEAKLQLVN